MSTPSIRKGVPIPPRHPKPWWYEALLSLKPKESFMVNTEPERIEALRQARIKGIKIVTRKEPDGYGIYRP